jgi:uncharacterized protein
MGPDTPESDDAAMEEAGRIMEGALGKLLYVSRSFVPDPPAGRPSATLVLEHIRYLRGLEAEGVLYGAGGYLDEDDQRLPESLTIIRADNEAEASRIARADPLHRDGYRSFELRRWRVNLGSVGVRVSFSDQRYQFD